MLHDFTNTTNSYLVLGNAPNRLVVAPGATQPFDVDFLTAEDLDQIDAGEFTVSPALPASIADVADATSQAAFNNKVAEQFLLNDTQIVFELAGPLAGTAGGAAVPVVLCVTDGDGTVSLFNDVAAVTVASTGTGVIAEAMPLKFENGKATINVTDAATETVTLSLSGGPAGLVIIDTIDIMYT